jgi:hypothetical protein
MGSVSQSQQSSDAKVRQKNAQARASWQRLRIHRRDLITQTTVI